MTSFRVLARNAARVGRRSEHYKNWSSSQLVPQQPKIVLQTTVRTNKYSTSAPKMAESVLASAKARRTYYQLSDETVVPDKKIHEIIQNVVLHTPSSFNSQSTRAVVLLGDEHKKLWEDIVKPAVKAVAPPEAWEGSNKRLSGFAAAYGTVSIGLPPTRCSLLMLEGVMV